LGLWPLIGCLPWPLLRPELRPPSKSTEVCFALTKGSSTGRRSSSKSSSSKGISGSSSGSRSSSSSSGHVSDSFFGGGGLYTARGKERRAHSHRLQQPQPTGAVHPGLMGRAAASVEAKSRGPDFVFGGGGFCLAFVHNKSEMDLCFSGSTRAARRR
jgi:hypothetical protein